MTVQAKAKIKRKHEVAIEGFQKWKRKHPMATTQQCYDAFDRFVDSVELEKLFR